MSKFELWASQDGDEVKSVISAIMPEEMVTLEKAQNLADEMNAIPEEDREPDDHMHYFVKEILE
jgi:hypothetical protein